MSTSDVLRVLFDPRGRIDRKGMIWLALFVLALQVVVYGTAWLTSSVSVQLIARACELVIFWICLCAAIKRLHDTGKGMVWVAIAIAATVAFSFVVVLVAVLTLGADALQPSAHAYWVILGLTMLPALAATIWLHVKRGEAHDNRYGPRPGPAGFSHEMRSAHYARA